MALLENQLVVKKSTLPKAGKGLFTTKDIKRGTKIVEYKGVIKTWKEITDANKFNGYVFYINKNHVIDAKNFDAGLAQLANDAKGISRHDEIKNNSKYEQIGKRVYIVATKNIPAGSEIFVGYGKEYWDVVRDNLSKK